MSRWRYGNQRWTVCVVHAALACSSNDTSRTCAMSSSGTLALWASKASKRFGSRYVSGRYRDWLKFKNPEAPGVKREADED